MKDAPEPLLACFQGFVRKLGVGDVLDVVVEPDMLELLGPAVNSGAGMFLYGAPGIPPNDNFASATGIRLPIGLLKSPPRAVTSAPKGDPTTAPSGTVVLPNVQQALRTVKQNLLAGWQQQQQQKIGSAGPSSSSLGSR